MSWGDDYVDAGVNAETERRNSELAAEVVSLRAKVEELTETVKRLTQEVEAHRPTFGEMLKRPGVQFIDAVGPSTGQGTGKASVSVRK